MESQTEQSAARLTISLREKPRELQLWLVDQLTVLAEALGEVVTPQRLQIYGADLSADLSQDQLRLALTRSRRECRFFPKIAELREFAGGSMEDHGKVETEAAWVFAMNYLRRWGVERLPLYQSGKRVEAPQLPARIEYAVRRIGGLRGLNQITEESRPFMFKDFCEAYRQAPIAELQACGLQGRFGAKQLLGTAKQLTGATDRARQPQDVNATKPTAGAKPTELIPCTPKRIPEPPTDAQILDRREMLRQQIAALSKATDAMGEQQ
jgi:hypothetical protein